MLDALKSKLFVEQQIHFIVSAVDPTVMATVCVFGIMGNGMLLSVFITHKENRTFPHSILMNLTAVDCKTLHKIVLQLYF
jgi:hypothetical protein